MFIYYNFLSNILKSKYVIEKITRRKCVSFVPPWNKPQRFYGLDLDTMPGTLIPFLSKLSNYDITKMLNKAGFKTYRMCYMGLFNKKKILKPKYLNKILCIPQTIKSGFSNFTKVYVEKVIKEKGLASVYAHPIRLAFKGPENKKHFIDFCTYLKKKEQQKKIEILLPRDLLEHEN